MARGPALARKDGGGDLFAFGAAFARRDTRAVARDYAFCREESAPEPAERLRKGGGRFRVLAAVGDVQRVYLRGDVASRVVKQRLIRNAGADQREKKKSDDRDDESDKQNALSHLRSEFVADPEHRFVVETELAQVTDIIVYGARFAAFVSPNVGEKFVAREHFVGIFEGILQQFELFA